MRASLGVLMLPIWKGVLDTLVKVMAERPVKVNAIQTFLVEMIYDISNKEKPQRPTYTINEDGKWVSPTYLPKKQSRMDMLFPDFARRLDVIFSKFVVNLEDYETAFELFKGNMSSKDPVFPLYFAYTLSQTSVYQVKEFLDYQQNEFDGEFDDFLEITLLKYRNLLVEDQFVMVENWRRRQQETQVGLMDEIKDDDNLEEWKRINGNLSQEEIKTFFSFLYTETNGEEEPFSTKEDIVELLKNGFVLPKEEPENKIKLNLEGKKNLTIVYYCAYELYRKHSGNRFEKDDIAKFFYWNFSNFSNTDLKGVKESIRNGKPNSMKFELFPKYLSED